MKELHIIEVSPHIYAGSVNKYASIDAAPDKINGEYITPSIPTGGIAYIFKKIAEYGHKGDMIFAADRYPTIKKDIFPGYKAARENRYKSREEQYQEESRNNQSTMVEEILQHCGFQVLAEDGYEADDIIFSICNRYKKQYDMIFIHTGDSDNYINVCDSVIAMPARKSDKIVTRQNYETTASSKFITPYNALQFYYFLYGKTSNSVGTLPKQQRDYIENALWTKQFFDMMGNKDFIRGMVEVVDKTALTQFDVIYPIDVEVQLLEMRSDTAKIEAWGSAVGSSMYYNKHVNKKLTEEMIQKFFDEGRAMNI